MGLRQRDSHLAVLLPLRDNRLNRGVFVRRVFPPIEISRKLQVTRIALPPLRKAA